LWLVHDLDDVMTRVELLAGSAGPAFFPHKHIPAHKLAVTIAKAARCSKLIQTSLNATTAGLTDGGCGVFANALEYWLPAGRVVTVMAPCHGPDEVQHYGLHYNGSFIDGMGVFPSEAAWINAMEREWDDLKSIIYIVHAFVLDEEVACRQEDSDLAKYELHMCEQLKAIHQHRRVPEAIL
jgi:hypothetical protein